MRVVHPQKGIVMNVKGVTSSVESFASYNKAEVKEKQAVEAAKVTKEDTGVVYEPTLDSPTSTQKANNEIIAKLKADAEERTAQLQLIVQKLISKQAVAFSDASDMWNFLREGNFTVDAATKAQAKEDISEDGYWGVKQTSDRIVDFAVALTGSDTGKLGDMLKAFKKGYAQAEKIWGGELPEISKKTYDAVIEKFNNLMNHEA